MARAKKFGTFGGVFTPSILTILGVIMYLRLPTIVGQAGLWRTLMIIAVAHIISVCTGLSVSSIATDKKVKAGGTYFMISRSLGLPIGGTLGLALFVGLSLSVSMYLIGFAESFLGYWNLPTDLNTLRLTAGIALVGVTAVTLISTALALKMQYWIMAAIILSLISIVTGRHELTAAAPGLAAAETAAPFIVLFGIFFPAVTGFEAGVSMSGDLKDAKRSIPVGTIAAIVVGFVVYALLTAFLAYTVDPAQLAGNPRVLLDIARVPQLVAAGIWGATISSAFGSILGAPRILQATSADRITPRWFAKGYGPENEPRHALVLCFAIAAGGILIGELNAIARIVSMFFITTYGFLNLTAAIESRVSPDFRPDFRVPAAVGVVGAAAAGIVMIQLDFLAAVGATLLLGAVYAVLKRRQLRLETGDAWEGVWSTVARSALARLHRADTHRRNWRPNVLAFATGSDQKTLVTFGRQLASRRGVLTHVRIVPPGTLPDLPGEAEDAPTPGLFTKRVESTDAYGSVEQVARLHGFAGMEPNTILLEWPRTASDQQRFIGSVRVLAAMDHNVLLLDVDDARGFGERATVDVWWRLRGNDVAYSLNLVRFLTASDDWRDARVRFLTVNSADSSLALPIRREMQRVLSDARVDADVVVVNNAVERRRFIDIIQSESSDTDLTLTSAADLGRGDPGRLVNDTNTLLDAMGTILVVHASSKFREPLLDIPSGMLDAGPATASPGAVEPDTPAFEAVEAAVLQPLFERLDASARAAADAWFSEYFARARTAQYEAVRDVGHDCMAAIERPDAPHVLIDQVVAAVERLREQTGAQRVLLACAVAEMLPHPTALVAGLPETVRVLPPATAFRIRPRDGAGARVAKLRRRTAAFLTRTAPSYTTPFDDIATAEAQRTLVTLLDRLLAAHAATAAQSLTVIERLLGTALDALATGNVETPLKEEVEGISAAQSASLDAERAATRTAVREWVGTVAAQASRVDAKRALRESRRAAPRESQISGVVELPDLWQEVHGRLAAQTLLTLHLARLRAVLDDRLGELRSRYAEAMEQGVVAPMTRLASAIRDSARESSRLPTGSAAGEAERAADARTLLEHVRSSVTAAIRDVPDTVPTVAEESLESAYAGRFADAALAELPARQALEYVIETEFAGPLAEHAATTEAGIARQLEIEHEVAQLAHFHLGSEADADAGDGVQIAAVIGNAVQRLDHAAAASRELAAAFDEAVARLWRSTAARLDAHSIHSVAARLPQYLRSRKGQAVLGGAAKVVASARGAITRLLVRLVYRRSEGAVLVERLRRDARSDGGSADRVRRFVDAVSPDPAVLERLPGYYRQLFSGHPAVGNEGVAGFRYELAEAESAWQLHGRGRSGALLVLGEQGQGRGTLCRLIASRLASGARTIRIGPPHAGSIDPAVFLARLGQALGTPARSVPTAVAALPRTAILIIDDLERWWERSPDGTAVLDVMDTLVARTPAFVVLNANTRAFHLINRVRPMDERILRVVECQPLNAERLRETVLVRHASTGFRLSLGGRNDDTISQVRIARLFDEYFRASEGNVGVALDLWLAAIVDFADDRVVIAPPARPPADPFHTLNETQVMLLAQFVLHERLSPERAARITGLDMATLARQLRMLERTGILVESQPGVLRIDRFVRPHIVRFLERREIV